MTAKNISPYKNIYSCTPEELLDSINSLESKVKPSSVIESKVTKSSHIESSHIESFRAKQIYHWLYAKYVTNFNDMKNVSKNVLQILTHRFQKISHIEPIKIEQSMDSTKKYLFKTDDNLSFESVCIKMKDKSVDENGKIVKSEKYTFCLSSQIGCKVGCAFCSTAKGGFIRNLSSGEIVEQVVFLKRDNNIDSNKSVNIVFMGMGEPLLNLKNVEKAVRIIAHKDGLNIATRRQTISTSGIAPQIKKLGSIKLGVQIALSLHAVDDKLRSELMPINQVYNIGRVLDSLREFPLKSRNRILFEYLMLKGKNDDLESAKKLVKLLHGFKAKVNIIAFNPHENSEFERPDSIKMQEFVTFLHSRGITATIRESRGLDISAACGQLREKSVRL